MKKRPDGRYQAQIVVGHKPDGKKIMKSVYGKTQKEVNAQIADLKVKLCRGEEIITADISLKDWSDKWFNTTKKGNVRYNTEASYTNCLKVHIIPVLGNLSLKNIKPLHIQDLINQMDKKSKNLKIKVLQTLNQIFNFAIQNGLIYNSPAKYIKATGEPPKTREALSAEEMEELINKAEEQMKLFCLLCLYAGLRRGEALAINKSDVDFDTEILHITKQVIFKINTPSIQKPKSKSSIRDIPIPPILINALKEHLNQNNSIYYFEHNNKIMSLTVFRKMWYKLTDQLSFPCTPHNLRHTYCTMLHSAGIDLKTAQYLMGHSDIKMTANIYTHIQEKQLTNIKEKIRNLTLGQSTDSQSKIN